MVRACLSCCERVFKQPSCQLVLRLPSPKHHHNLKKCVELSIRKIKNANAVSKTRYAFFYNCIGLLLRRNFGRIENRFWVSLGLQISPQRLG